MSGWRATAIALLVASAVTACGSDTVSRDGPGNAVGAAVSIDRNTTPRTTQGTMRAPKAVLQSTLDDLLTEHVELVLATTGATARGSTADATEARRRLDENTEKVVDA